MNRQDSYDIAAQYYDAAYASKEDLNDLPFYLGCVEKYGGPVLEVACGTGRVLVPIASLGVETHGLDNSKSMLKVLKRNLDQVPYSTRRLVTFHQGDMRDFDLGRRFRLILAPFRPLQHMYSLDDQLAAFRSMKSHLDHGGIIVFDVFYPNFEMLAAGIGQERQDLEWESDGLRMTRSFLKTDFDKIQQTFSGKFIYRRYKDDHLLSEETAPLKMSYYTYPHLQALFRIVGLEVLQEFGGFDESPLTNDTADMVFVLRAT